MVARCRRRLGRLLPGLVVLICGCSSIHLRTEHLPHLAANIALDQLDNYADKGSFPKLDAPILTVGPLELSTSGRLRRHRHRDADDPPRYLPRPRASWTPRCSLRADRDSIYFELKFRF